MSFDVHPNFAYSTVATAPSPAASGTTLVVASGDGAKFASFPFNATIWPAGAQPTAANSEIVRITGRSTDTLTITRAQESSSARTIIATDQIAVTATQKVFTDIETDLASADAQIALQSAQIECKRLADLGQFVYSGLTLTANASALTSVSSTIATSLFNKTTHGLVANDTIQFTGLSTTTGVTNGTTYFVSATSLTANAFRVAATAGGTAITLGGTTDAAITVTQVGKLDMAAGVSFMATTELNASAQTAISTTIASMADATNPKWVSVELNSSNVVVFNQGTAAASPAFPTIATTNTPLGFLFVPSSAVNTTAQVDANLTTTNNFAKLIDARNVRSIHVARKFFQDLTGGTATNPTSLASIMSGTMSIPANSLNVGDEFDILIGAVCLLVTSNNTLRLQVTFGGITVWNYTTPTLTASATQHSINLGLSVVVTAIGASATVRAEPERFVISAPVAINSNVQETSGGAANGDAAMGTRAGSATFDSTGATTLDIQALIGTSQASSTVTLRSCRVRKIPA